MRVRIRFSKQGKVRWTSHRDVARMWERAFRRAGLAVCYTEGFTPRPRVSFGLALPTGHESLAEYLDVETFEGVQPGELAAQLSDCLPVGVDAMAVAVADAGEGSLQQQVSSCSWRIELAGLGCADLELLVDQAMSAECLPLTVRRKGRDILDDVRPAVVAMAVDSDDSHRVLNAELATRQRGVRPAELLAAVRSDLELSRALRTHQWIERDGARWEPIPLGATGAPHALERAS